jgi:hypothetical protein
MGRIRLKVENNYFKNYSKTIYFAVGDSPSEGFAYGSGNIFENSPAQTANTCNSFNPPYTIIMDKAEDIPAMVTKWAGINKLDLNAPTSVKPDKLTDYNQFICTPGSEPNQLDVSFYASVNCTALLSLHDYKGRTLI